MDFETRGQGEAVLLLHGAILSDTFAPLMREEALAGFQLVRYRRRGYGDSDPVRDQPSIGSDADDARALLGELAYRRRTSWLTAGAARSLCSLAASFPQLVRSSVLLEGADHSLQTTKPAAVATVIAEFLRRHPMHDGGGLPQS